MTIKRIHINQHVIKNNKKTGARDPVISVKMGKQNIYAYEVLIAGPCNVVYSPDKPLKCGATTWIETHSEVEIK